MGRSVVIGAILFLSTNSVDVIPSNEYAGATVETGQGMRTSADESSFRTMPGWSTSPSYFVVASLLDACLQGWRVGFLGLACSCGHA